MQHNKPYHHIYGGQAVDMVATREEIIARFGHDPALMWAPKCKVLDFSKGRDEITVSSTDNRDEYIVTHIMR